MPWIVNEPLSEIINGNHPYEKGNTALIRILDEYTEIPPYHKFERVFEYVFLDIEEETNKSITKNQGISIISALQYCLDNNINVVVHCTVGLCRSGAVVEVAEMLGFQRCRKLRMPNLLVKRILMDAAGMETYS